MIELTWVLMLAASAGSSAGAPVQLREDPRAIAVGLFLDTPLPAETIDRSLAILSGLRCRYGLTGGVRDDEEAASRAFQEIDALEFTPQDKTRMADSLGVSLAPEKCREACEQFEQLVLLKLRMEALEKLATAGACEPTRAPTGAEPRTGDAPRTN